MERITEYLNKDTSGKRLIDISDDTICDRETCFLNTLRTVFGEKNLSCRCFYDVISGEGKEKDKITTAYSSSLQSFLIFGKVSNEYPIYINGVKYTKVYFEYKNKVIGYPSSVDVVLVSEDGKKQLYIESKLYEPIRDSSKVGTKEVGPSYYSKDENGFSKLGLTYENLDKMGFDMYGHSIADKLFGLTASVFKNNVASSPKDNAYDKINAINGNRYVYSYGIKQILAHVIGILNINNPDKNCSDDLKCTSPEERELVYVYNALPGFDEDATEKLEAFRKHYDVVKSVINDKKLGVKIGEALTYQDIYNEQEKVNKGYFSAETVRYFKLDK